MAAAAAAIPRARLSTFQQAMLSLYWFSTSLHWAAILIITLPSQAAFIAGDEFKVIALVAHDERLHDALFADGIGQFLERLRREILARLEGTRADAR